MQYREFGNTGVKISALGFGCMRLPEFEKDGKWYIDEEKAIPLLQKGVELGINYFDTAYYYCHENSQYTVGKALKPFRDKVSISSKIPLGDVKEQRDYRRILEETLRRMGLEYLDFYHFHGIDKNGYDHYCRGEFKQLEEARKAKEEGLIRHISFSFHGKPDDMKYIIDDSEGIIETVLCQYNLLDRANEEAIAYARSKGRGVVAMGPVAGGRLAAPSDLYKKFLGKESNATYELALRFVLGNSNINCALSGMSTMDMLEQNVAVANAAGSLSGEDWEKVAKMVDEIQGFSDLYCTGCSYCMPCPQNIQIPQIFNTYNTLNVFKLSEPARDSYRWYKNENKWAGQVADCVGCGTCASKCPQKIDIPSKLKQADEVLSKLFK